MLLVAFDNINVDNISVGYRGLYRIQGFTLFRAVRESVSTNI